MSDESDEPSSPDEVRYSEPLSRRRFLAAGATAAATGTAGCAGTARDVGQDLGLIEEEVWGSEDLQRARTQLEVVEGYELELGEATLDSLQFSLKNGLLPNQQPEEAVEGTLRVYGKTPIGDDEVVLGETGASFRGSSQEHEMSLEFGEDLMNVPRMLEVRFASPQLDAPEIVLGRSDVVYLPFDNVARDEQTLRELGPPYVPPGDWSDPRGQKQKVEIWYSEPDEPSFNMPALDMTQYTTQTADGDDWFDLYDIQMTVVIRSPVLDRKFATDDEGDILGAYCDWTVLNLELSALEYLESIYFNSPPTMKLFNPANNWSVGTGGVRQKEVENKQDFGGSMIVDKDEYGESRASPREVSHVAQDASPASDAFIRGALHEQVGYDDPFEPDELRTVNPVKFCVGRSFARRWGEKFSEAIENKPYANTFESIEFRKLTTLKAFVGDLDYQFTISLYQQTPEETIVNMFLRDTTARDIPGSDCVTSTMLFIGVGHWMTGKHPVMVRTDVSQGLDHIFAGFHNLDIPEMLSEIPEIPIAGYDRFEESGRSAREVDYKYTDVECTEPYPSIGFNRHMIDNPSRRLVAWSDLTEFDLTTNIPLNDGWEPDVDGEIRAPGDGYFGDLFVNPFDTAAFYFFEDERNR
ncbi:hypothetical protein SAMN04487949_3043 [Halogranum gelatinilyticum]|uniref:Uncharacterized protein n=1 Tax=Halogranum gelatinilyticum TaxID=660521 RepID=A0A1G9XN64_9EURY|nr:hypothetical protein [Halogranum gelatinilyticum]SDM97683.1 hypothetical protein SAMN04487949_3043 [Halogranum gelatinilyticum]